MRLIFIPILLLAMGLRAQDIQSSLERLNSIRVEKHLPKMVYAKEMQRYCDLYAHYLAEHDTLIHSSASTYNECINRITLDLDPILAFQESAPHWNILMSYWENHICVGTFKKNNRLYVVVRTY